MDRYDSLRRALSWPIATRSFAVALIVGSILNIIIVLFTSGLPNCLGVVRSSSQSAMALVE